MGMQCEVCGKKPVVGNQITWRGKAKYLGGVGRKPTGISKRVFKPNLQTLQCQVGGSVQTLRVIPVGLRPTPRSEEHTSELQSQSNLVCRLLLEKKKKK